MIRTAETKYGKVMGLPAADPRITSFKGIPFAAPPVGENRWRAPQPLKPWDGILKAYEFAPISFQDVPGLGDNIYNKEWNVDPDIPMSEDSLYLNIWTNAKDASAGLPVLVWYYGGGFQWGNTAEMEFDGERIARRDIVVVTVSYRLAAFGFLAHPDITKEAPEAPGNFGTLDQQAGLKWVIENIAAFGGDPKNITIAGQSAGGGSVMNQLACRENEGRFQRAVILSGMIRDPYMVDDLIVPKDISVVEKNGEAFFETLGVKTLEEARKLDAAFIRAKYAEFRTTHSMFAPMIDHKFLEADPYDLLIEGKTVNVPIMSGNTSDEFFTGITADSEEEFESKAREIYMDKADEFLSFPEARISGMGKYAYQSVVAYAVKAAFMKRKENPANEKGYYYCFGPDLIPGPDNPGCFHSVDLWFFFETLAKCWRPFVGWHYDLARQMCDYFCNFIKKGDPNGTDLFGNPLPLWGAYSEDEPNEMHFVPGGATPKIVKSDYIAFMSRYFLK